MKRLDNKTNLDLILEHQMSSTGEELPKHLQLIFDRWDYANNLVKNYLSADDHAEKPKNFSYSEIANMLIRKFGISRATAYRDINDSQLFFGSINKQDKNYWRQIFLGIGMKALQMSLKKNDYDRIFRGIEKLSEMLGLNKDDSNMPDWSKLQPNLYYMMLQVNNKYLKIDLNETDSMEPELIDRILNHITDTQDIDCEIL